MSGTGLGVFDRTVQTTNIWLNDLGDTVGPDRQAAWQALGAVLRTLRDRLPPELGAHLGAELPLLVRGAYYHRYQPDRLPRRFRDRDEFLRQVRRNMDGMRPVDVGAVTAAVLRLLDAHLPPGQCEKLRQALPEEIRSLWDGADGEAAYAGDERFRGDNERGFGARRAYDEDAYDSGYDRSGRRSAGIEGVWREAQYRGSDERPYAGRFDRELSNPPPSHAPRYQEDDRRLRSPKEDLDEDRRYGAGQPGWSSNPRRPSLSPTWFPGGDERRPDGARRCRSPRHAYR